MGLSPQERDALIEQYARGADEVRRALATVPKEALQWRPGPGKWSAHEIVVHCADSETNAALRIRYVIAEKEPLVVGYDQDEWARRFDYHGQPLEESLAAAAAARSRTVPLLRQMTEADWDTAFDKSIAVYLNGQGIPDLDPRGHRVTDDSFLICFNAHYEPIRFTLPPAEFGAQWKIVVDTADPDNGGDALFPPGGSGPVQARSLVVLQAVNDAETQD